MQGDAYIRFGPRGTRFDGNADAPNALVFVDLERQDIGELREVPHEVLRRVGTLLVRAEPVYEGKRPAPWAPTLDAVQRIAERLDLNCRVGLVHHPVGAPPHVESADIPAGDNAALLRRAREVELRALLEWGNAVWQPLDYHFRLPSGDHTATFVKLGDAIRQPRDAQVIASWLNRHLTDELGIVCDAVGLVGVLEALRVTMRAAGLSEGPVSVLERYPSTSLAVRQAVNDAHSERGSLLAVMSVSSSGRLAGRLHDALLASAGAVAEWALEILVSRERYALDHVDVWIGDGILLGEQHSNAGACAACMSPASARLVPINPVSFDGMLTSQLRQLMPDTTDARANRRFWELCSAADAIGLEEEPDGEVAEFRPSPTKMPIHFRHAELLKSSAYREAVVARIAQMLDDQQELVAREKWSARRPLSGNASLVLVPEHERKMDGYNELWEMISPLLAREGAELVTFPRKGHWRTQLDKQVQDADDILVLALGLVTGGSITKALTGVQRARRDEHFELAALVVHARPTQQRSWKTLRNAYAHRLFEVWLSLLPDRSPLQEEDDVLGGVNGDTLDEHATTFLNQRKAFVSGDSGEESVPMFWGAKADAELSPHSLYGESLRSISTFVGVGASMERARQQARRNAVPELPVFELRALLASYFDKMILAAVLRWLEPEEAWWGDTPDAAEQTMLQLLQRAEPEDLLVLVPELLLAIAQGKLPERAAAIVRDRAELLLEQPIGEEARAALEVGLAVADQGSHSLAQALATPAPS